MRKKQRQAGLEYTNKGGNLVPGKACKPKCSNCRLKCCEKISDDQRLQIFHLFWKLTDLQKKQFYSANIIEYASKNLKKNSRRSFTREYSLPVGGVSYVVCQIFFLNTLNISEKRIHVFLSNIRNDKKLEYESKHGAHTKNVISSVELKVIKDHISSFPTLPSHYARKDTQKDFLDPSLNLNKMYAMYVPKS
jgi:hypothetical protein